MAEILHEYTWRVRDERNREYRVRACGEPRDDGTWGTWLEFIPTGEGESLRTGQESSQPGRNEALYWASGVESVYLEGAFERARRLANTASAHAGPASP